MSRAIVGGAMLPHAPQFFTLPDTEDRQTVGKAVKDVSEPGGPHSQRAE